LRGDGSAELKQVGILLRSQYSKPALSVDSRPPVAHVDRAMDKPRKVEEPSGAYSASPKKPETKSPQAPAQPTVRYADEKTFRKAADKVFKTHKELFRRLAQ
jgi:hypothetical protein